MGTTQDLKQEVIDEFVGVCHGDFARVRALLEEHPNLVNANAGWKETGIEAAAQTGQVAIAELLLAAGAPLDICTAAMLGRKDQVVALLQGNPELIEATGAHGIPLMYFPVIRGHIDLAEYLFSRGANVNAGAGGNTPLHGAVMFGRLDMVNWLLNHGAKPDLLDYNGKTPLELATENGQGEIVNAFKTWQS